MSKSLLFQIIKQILVNLVVHLFYERRFLVNGTSVPPRDTQLPFDMLFITMFYTCHAKEVVYHRGEQLRIRKSLKLYKVLYRNTMKNIKISLNKIWYTYTALIPKKIWWILYSINANFDSNILVEQMTKILGKDARFIVKCPFVLLKIQTLSKT